MNEQRSSGTRKKVFIIAMFLIVISCVATSLINTEVVNKVLPVLKPTPSLASQEIFPAVGKHPAWIVIPAICILTGVLLRVVIAFYESINVISNDRGDWGCSILLVLAAILIVAVLILTYK